MPPRVVGAGQAGNGLGAFVESLPPITRFLAGTIFALALAHYLGLINPYNLALMWPQIYKQYHVRAALGRSGAGIVRKGGGQRGASAALLRAPAARTSGEPAYRRRCRHAASLLHATTCPAPQHTAAGLV